MKPKNVSPGDGAVGDERPDNSERGCARRHGDAASARSSHAAARLRVAVRIRGSGRRRLHEAQSWRGEARSGRIGRCAPCVGEKAARERPDACSKMLQGEVVGSSGQSAVTSERRGPTAWRGRCDLLMWRAKRFAPSRYLPRSGAAPKMPVSHWRTQEYRDAHNGCDRSTQGIGREGNCGRACMRAASRKGQRPRAYRRGELFWSSRRRMASVGQGLLPVRPGPFCRSTITIRCPLSRGGCTTAQPEPGRNAPVRTTPVSIEMSTGPMPEPSLRRWTLAMTTTSQTKSASTDARTPMVNALSTVAIPL